MNNEQLDELFRKLNEDLERSTGEFQRNLEEQKKARIRAYLTIGAAALVTAGAIWWLDKK